MKAGVVLIILAVGLVRLVATGFIFSFFWCVSGAIYLLLRQDVDDKELDDVYQPAETPAPKGPLPAAQASAPASTSVPANVSQAGPDQRLIETVQVPPSS